MENRIWKIRFADGTVGSYASCAKQDSRCIERDSSGIIQRDYADL